MFLQQIIERYKAMRKQKFLDLPGTYQHKYAFVGVGQHSISNLYPVLQYLAVPLKRICTLNKQNADRMAMRFAGCNGTQNLEDILHDDTIKGVFVSAAPNSHYRIVSQLLDAGKFVLVEKPPCQHKEELLKLIGHPNAHQCLAGLQKRFSTINQLLQRTRSQTNSYSYRYLTGLYPEGNPMTELFIHPVDNLVYLYGKMVAIQVQRAPKGKATWFATVRHENGVSGVLHLSTEHSWKAPVDELLIHTNREILEATYPYSLVSTAKPPALFGIPAEKLSGNQLVKKVLLESNGFIPTVTHNTVALQGFLGEVEYFLKMTEQNIRNERHHIQTLAPVYEILGQLSAC